MVVAWGPPQADRGAAQGQCAGLLGERAGGDASPRSRASTPSPRTRPVWEIAARGCAPQRRASGSTALPLRAVGAQAPAFRAALLELKQQDGRWQEYAAPVTVAGGRLFSARVSFPDTVQTGDYRVEVLLVRERRIVARQELFLRVDRVGTAASHRLRRAHRAAGLWCGLHRAGRPRRLAGQRPVPP